MISTTTYKFRIYPNQNQIDQFHRDFGSAKFAWNYLRRICKQEFDSTAQFDANNKYIPKTGKKPKYQELSKILTQLRKDFDFMKIGMRTAQQQKLLDLEQAYSNFFQNPKHFGLPKYKDKDSHKSTRYQDCKYPVKDNALYVAGMGWIKCKNSYSKQHKKKQKRDPNLPDLVIQPKMTQISLDKSGCWWATISCEQEFKSLELIGKSVGIDLGIKSFAVMSDGTSIEYNKKELKKLRRRSKRYQRSADKSQQGSRKNKKQRRLQNKTNKKIKNKIEDLQHKTTTEIIKNNQVIAIEDLNIVGMLKNPKLSRSIKEQNWGSFIHKLNYKSTRAGRTFVRVPRFFPSSKLCSVCGHKMEKMPLSIRTWICPVCGANHDRDLNAAINIIQCGFKQLVPGGTGELKGEVIETNQLMATQVDQLAMGTQNLRNRATEESSICSRSVIN